jgi:hypothetical protein
LWVLVGPWAVFAALLTASGSIPLILRSLRYEPLRAGDMPAAKPEAKPEVRAKNLEGHRGRGPHYPHRPAADLVERKP